MNGNMHMKGHSLLLVIREMQIKITEGFYSSCTRVAVIEKIDGNNWINVKNWRYRTLAMGLYGDLYYE